MTECFIIAFVVLFSFLFVNVNFTKLYVFVWHLYIYISYIHYFYFWIFICTYPIFLWPWFALLIHGVFLPFFGKHVIIGFLNLYTVSLIKQSAVFVSVLQFRYNNLKFLFSFINIKHSIFLYLKWYPSYSWLPLLRPSIHFSTVVHIWEGHPHWVLVASYIPGVWYYLEVPIIAIPKHLHIFIQPPGPLGFSPDLHKGFCPHILLPIVFPTQVPPYFCLPWLFSSSSKWHWSLHTWCGAVGVWKGGGGRTHQSSYALGR